MFGEFAVNTGYRSDLGLSEAVSAITRNLEEAYLALVKDPRLYSCGLEQASSVIAQRCANALSLNSVSIWLLSEDKTKLVSQAESSLAINSTHNDLALAVNDIALYFDTLCSEDIVTVSDALADARVRVFYDTNIESQAYYSILDSVIRHQGEGVGLLRFEFHGEEKLWNSEERLFIASVADLVSQRMRMHDLAQSEESYESLFRYTNEGIIIFEGPAFIKVNPAACKIFGGTVEELIGKSPIELSPEFQKDGQPSAEKAMAYIQACLAGEPQNFEWTQCRLDGSEFTADITLNAVRLRGEDTLFALVRDISAKKEAERIGALAQAEIEYRAAHDSLTGLQNREQLHSYVDKLIARANEEDSALELALLLFDLNRFKEINDTLGHATGDKVLIKLADLLRGPVESNGGGLFRLVSVVGSL